MKSDGKSEFIVQRRSEKSTRTCSYCFDNFYKGQTKPTDHSRFTLYSLRSTYITHNLLMVSFTRVIADNCGTSESEIESTYYRINNLLNIDELGMPEDFETRGPVTTEE